MSSEPKNILRADAATGAEGDCPMSNTDAGVQNGKSHIYKIKAKNAAGENSSFVKVTAKPKAPAPAKSPGFEAAIVLGPVILMAALVQRTRKKE